MKKTTFNLSRQFHEGVGVAIEGDGIAVDMGGYAISKDAALQPRNEGWDGCTREGWDD